MKARGRALVAWAMPSTYVPIGRAILNRDIGTCDGIPCSDHYFVHSQVILPTPRPHRNGAKS
jgi:hypothetical protein